MAPLITNDAVVLGMLICLLALVFTADKRFPKIFKIVPALLLCYFLPALLHWPLGLIAPEWYTADILEVLAKAGVRVTQDMNFEDIQKAIREAGLSTDAYSGYVKRSNLYFMASRYLLPASLVLLCLSIDLKAILNLGPKALIMFFTATAGIVIGGPVALFICVKLFPGAFNAPVEELWRGLSTVAGSWIGGGANQTAMKEIYSVPNGIFASMIVVDIIVANIWMAFLLYGSGQADRIDRWLKADSSAISDLRDRVEKYSASVLRIPTTTETFQLLAVAFGGVAISHFFADLITPFMKGFGESLASIGLHSLLSGFFWLIVVATTIGVAASFTSLRKLEGVGASRWGSVFIYVLVATIGMNMNIGEAIKEPGFFAVGLIWMLVHVSLLLLVAKLIRAPFFFVAVGSQANVGGAASAPVVASAFSPALAPVGVLLAVLGYAVGTYGAIACAELMRWLVS